MNVVRNEWNNNGKKIRLWMYYIVSFYLDVRSMEFCFVVERRRNRVKMSRVNFKS